MKIFCRSGLDGHIRFVVLCFGFATAMAGVQSTPAVGNEIDHGRKLAVAHCGVCHAVGRHDDSPTRVNSETAFRDLHKRFPIAMLLEAAKSGAIEGHDEMPAFMFSRDDMTALLAYIDELAPVGSGKYVGAAN